VSPPADSEPQGRNRDSGISFGTLWDNGERRKKGGMVMNVRECSSSKKGPETKAREPRGNSQDRITDLTTATSY